MPQVAVNRQLQFTNHWIGIYERGSTLIPRATPGKALAPSGPVPSPADPAQLAPLFQQALADREKKFGPKSGETARSSSDLGLFLKTLGDNAAAVAPLEKALEIDQSNASSAVSLDQENLAAVLLASGKRQAAYDLFRAAAQGPDPGVAARCLTELGALDPPNAEAYYRLALQQQEKASGKDDRLIAVVLNDLGLALRAKEQNQPAEPLFRRALAIQEKTLGPDHPATASTLINLGSLLQSNGQLEEAERLERRALRIFEQKLGPESTELATACTNLADLLWTKHDRIAAVPLYRRALSIDESLYGPEDPELATDLVNLGMLLKETGQRDVAISFLERAVGIYEKVFGANSPQALKLREIIEKSTH